MKKEMKRLTTAQFAKLHEVNKRTLHYYDDIGLFCPLTKEENGYRYYDISQSIDFEYIRMLKELNMSIKEIEMYRKQPTPDNFLKIADTKEQELDKEIQKLKNIKRILQAKKEQIVFCESLREQEIRVEECKSERILTFPYDFSEDDISQIFSPLKSTWGIEQIRMGIGSFISLEGARTVVCENLPETLIENVTYIKVNDTEDVVGKLATTFYGDPTSKLELVGVTGTNGKTTIATLLYCFCKSTGIPIPVSETAIWQ